MAGLSLSLLIIVGVVTWVVVDDRPYVAPEPDASPARAEPALAAATLHELEEAVAEDDPAAAEKLAAPGDDRARRLLAAMVENAQALRVEDFTLRYVDELGAVSATGEWAAAVDVTWAFAGFDTTPSRAEVRFEFRTGEGRALLASVGGGDRRSPIWLTGPLEVRRSPETLVLVDGTAPEADTYARRATTAVPAVLRLIPDWRPRLVVEVPETAGKLHQALAADPGTYANIAAVTATADGSLAPDAPVHVFVNPEVFGELRPTGAQVVMSHEAVHVATDAATSTVPLWLLEGFADYVALRDVDLPLSTTAGQIIKRVRRAGPPARLPGPAEFDTATSHLGATYESAWLACRVLVDTGGEDALVRFYERVSGGSTVGDALRAEFGLTQAELTRAWQELLTDLAA